MLTIDHSDAQNDAQPNSQSSIFNSQLKSVPLSYAQMGVYVECMKNPTSTIYNIPFKVAFPKTIDTQALADALRSLVKLHPQLTIHFGSEGSETVQIVEPEQQVEISISNLSEEELEHYKHEFVRPFNLNRGPLYHFDHTYIFCMK